MPRAVVQAGLWVLTLAAPAQAIQPSLGPRKYASGAQPSRSSPSTVGGNGSSLVPTPAVKRWPAP
jgi:hypothetical protein